MIFLRGLRSHPCPVSISAAELPAINCSMRLRLRPPGSEGSSEWVGKAASFNTCIFSLLWYFLPLVSFIIQFR